MKLTQFFNSQKLIKEQKEKLEQQEKELIEEAYKEGLFEISLQSFLREFNKLNNSISYKIEDIDVKISRKVPRVFSQDLSEALDWLRTEKIKELQIGIPSIMYIPFETEPEFSDGSKFLDNAFLEPGCNIFGERVISIKPSSKSKLLLNIHPTSQLLKDEKIGQAILNAVKSKERKANMTKHSNSITGAVNAPIEKNKENQ